MKTAEQKIKNIIEFLEDAAKARKLSIVEICILTEAKSKK